MRFWKFIFGPNRLKDRKALSLLGGILSILLTISMYTVDQFASSNLNPPVRNIVNLADTTSITLNFTGGGASLKTLYFVSELKINFPEKMSTESNEIRIQYNKRPLDVKKPLPGIMDTFQTYLDPISISLSGAAYSYDPDSAQKIKRNISIGDSSRIVWSILPKEDGRNSVFVKIQNPEEFEISNTHILLNEDLHSQSPDIIELPIFVSYAFGLREVNFRIILIFFGLGVGR